jgi:AraC-like DNA-binding protein
VAGMRTKLYTRYFSTSIIILIVPLFIGVIAYIIAFNAVEKKQKDSNMAILEQSIEVLEYRFEEVGNILEQLTVHNKVQKNINVKDFYTQQNIVLLRDIITNLLNYNMSNNFLHDYYIILKKGEVAVSASTAYKLKNFYNTYFYNSIGNYEQWYSDILDVYHMKDFFKYKAYEINGDSVLIAYMQSIGFGKDIKGTVIGFVKEEEVQSMLKRLNISDGGFAYIIDKTGEVVTSLSTNSDKLDTIEIPENKDKDLFSKNINNKQMMISYAKSRKLGWTFVVAQPSGGVMKEVNQIKYLIMIISSIALIIGLALVIYVTYNNMRPVKLLADDNKRLSEELTAQIPLLKSVFIERLLRGSFKTSEEIQNRQKKLNMTLVGINYGVVIICIKDTYDKTNDDLTIKHLLVKDTITNLVKKNVYFNDVDDNKIAMVFSFEEDMEECTGILENIINSIYPKVNTITNCNTIYSIGDICSNMIDIPRSFEQAMQGIDYIELYTDKNLISYCDIPKSTEAYYFPQDIENRLINLVKSGEEKEVNALLRQICNENIINRQLSPEIINLFLNDFLGAIIKGYGQNTVNDIPIEKNIKILINEFNTYADTKKLSSILELYSELTEFYNGKKKSHNDKLKSSIINYIYDNYNKYDFSLVNVADQFCLAEAYLSQFFKEQVGQNFSVYVQNLRMSKAEKLLIETDMPIKKIIQEVGYNSLNTFGKAFKRIHGLSSTEFRNLYGKNNI